MIVMIRVSKRCVTSCFNFQQITKLSTSSVFQQKIINSSLNTHVVHKNMTLKKYGSALPTTLRAHGIQMAVQQKPEEIFYLNEVEPKRPLTVILAWLAAKEKHLEKYRSFWLQRGYDVLTVKMTPYQFLAPKIGAKKLVTDLLRFLYSSSNTYDDILFHCFSVGAYEFGEMLTQLQDNEMIKQIQEDCKRSLVGSLQTSSSSEDCFGDPKDIIEKRIKGIIFDSAVNFKGIGVGVSRSITSRPLLVKLLEKAIDTHLKVAYPFATRYYEEASDNAHNNILKSPALIMVSETDKIGTTDANENLRKCWTDRGIDVTFKKFEKAGHVQLISSYPEEYVKELENFLLTKVKLNSN